MKAKLQQWREQQALQKQQTAAQGTVAGGRGSTR